MALLRTGFMPFLTLFLHARGLGPQSIGLVMSVGSVVALVATVPGGVLVDQTRGRSFWLLLAGLVALGASWLLVEARGLAALLCAVAMMSLAEAVVAPAVLVMNLDSVPRDALLDQLGRNQAFGHVGRVVGLVLSGMIGSHFGFPALITFETLYLLVLLLLVWRAPLAPRRHIASVAGIGTGAALQPGTALILLGVALGLFQLGNAVLPVLLGLSLAQTSDLSAPVLASVTTMIAQVAMIGGSFLAVPALRKWGHWPVLASSFAILPLRCAVAALLPASIAILPVELMHGLSESIQLVAIASVIGEFHGTSGRVGTRYGSVMLLQHIGTAASPLLGGYVAERWTCAVAYPALGAIGLLALGVWILWRPQLVTLSPRGKIRLA